MEVAKLVVGRKVYNNPTTEMVTNKLLSGIQKGFTAVSKKSIASDEIGSLRKQVPVDTLDITRYTNPESKKFNELYLEKNKITAKNVSKELTTDTISLEDAIKLRKARIGSLRKQVPVDTLDITRSTNPESKNKLYLEKNEITAKKVSKEPTANSIFWEDAKKIRKERIGSSDRILDKMSNTPIYDVDSLPKSI